MPRRGKVTIVIGGSPTTFTHRQLYQLFRGIVTAQARQGNGPTLTSLFSEYEKKLQPTIDPSRRRRLIFGPLASFTASEEEFFCSVIREECSLLQPAEVDAIVRQVLAQSASGSEQTDDLSSWEELLQNNRLRLAEILQLAPQHQLQPLAGEYFIVRIRQLRDREVIYLVSHMTVRVSSSDHEAATFVTQGPQQGGSRDPAFVDGVFYEADNFLFAWGKVRDRAPFRASILELVPRSEATHGAQPVNDLRGIRLGLGRFLDLPQAYRIWCSKLDPAPEGTDWRDWIGEYSEADFKRRFGDHVANFSVMLEWLAAQGPLRLIDE